MQGPAGGLAQRCLDMLAGAGGSDRGQKRTVRGRHPGRRPPRADRSGSEPSGDGARRPPPARRSCRHRRCPGRGRAGRRRPRATSLPRPGMPRPALAPAMSNASHTSTPSNPSPPRSCRSTAAENVAGRFGSRARNDEVRGHHRPRTPAAHRRRKGTSSLARRTSSQASANGRRDVAVLARVAVTREVLHAGADSGRLQALDVRRVCRATSSGSAPKLRTPITGLRGLEFTSATGARSRSTPAAASAVPIEAATRLVRPGSSTAPRAALPGAGDPGRVQAGDVAALLVGGDEHVGPAACTASDRARTPAYAGCWSRTGTPSPARPRAAALPRSEESVRRTSPSPHDAPKRPASPDRSHPESRTGREGPRRERRGPSW